MMPAIAAGITDKLMGMEDIVLMINDAEMKETIQKRAALLSVPQSS